MFKTGHSGGGTGTKTSGYIRRSRLKDVLEEVVALHAAAHEGPPVIISLAQSGVLCCKSNLTGRQILSFLRIEYRPIIFTIGLWSQNSAYAA